MYGDPDSEPTGEDRHAGGDMPFYTREWRFDPYHQALSFARAHAPDESKADTEWRLWEVFQQSVRGEHHAHVGSLHAPDAEIALVLAKENYARRGACVNLWVVPAASIHATDYLDADVFEHTTDKSYREPSGYHGLRKTMKAGGRVEAEDAVADGDGDGDGGGGGAGDGGDGGDMTEARS